MPLRHHVIYVRFERDLHSAVDGQASFVYYPAVHALNLKFPEKKEEAPSVCSDQMAV